MPKYLTSGWERFSFIVTPSELEEIIKDFHLLIISRHVPYGYRETPPQEYLEDYRNIYTKLATGRQVTNRDIWNFVEIGIAGSLETHTYGNLHTYQGTQYQSADFDEPCAVLRHFPLYLSAAKDGKPSLSISASSIQYPEKTVGLELLFPKQIQYPCGEGYSSLQATKDLASYQDFELLRNRIKGFTKPLRLMVSGKEVRPRVRISRNALKDIDSFWFLQKNQIYAIQQGNPPEVPVLALF